MLVNRLKFFTLQLLPSVVMMADSNAGGSMPEAEEVQDKVKTSKNRRIPVVKFILLLVVIVIAALVMEYFL